MRMFKFSQEEVRENVEEHYPDGRTRMRRHAKENLTGKCGGCNWEKDIVYVYAPDFPTAWQLLIDGEAGLCGDCMCELLVDSKYNIEAGEKDAER